MVDVDHTLIAWGKDIKIKARGDLKLIDPYDGETKYVKPLKKHVELVKHFANRGYFMVVWSGSGGEWADAVVDLLDIREYVGFVMGKPEKYMDDMDCSMWMGNRVYIEEQK